LFTEPCPIKLVGTAPSKNIRANKIEVETAKTGRVTAVVARMSIFCDAIHGALIPEMRRFLTNRQKMLISWRKIPVD